MITLDIQRARVRTPGRVMRDYMRRAGVTAETLAESLILPVETIHAYMEDRDRPPELIALAISHRLRVTGTKFRQSLAAVAPLDERLWVNKPGRYLLIRCRMMHITQEEAAQRVGVSAINFLRWVHDRHTPNAENRVSLGYVLEFDPHRLWPDAW